MFDPKVIEYASTVVFDPNKRNLAIRSQKDSPLPETWNITKNIREFLCLPVRNLECRLPKCTRELADIVDRMTNPDATYKCTCNEYRYLKNLRIDFATADLVAKARSYSQDIKNLEYSKDQRCPAGLKVNVFSNGEVSFLLEEEDKQQEVGKSLIIYEPQNQESFLQNKTLSSDVKPFFQGTEEMKLLCEKAKETHELFQEIFEDYEYEPNLKEIEQNMQGIFEECFEKETEKSSTLHNLSFHLMEDLNRGLECYYSYINLYFSSTNNIFCRVPLVDTQNRFFKIPRSSRFSVYNDPQETVTRIVITGGFSELDAVLKTAYQISFSGGVSGTREVNVKEGVVKEISPMKKERAYHSIYYDTHRKQIIVFGGMLTAKTPAGFMEFGRRASEKSNWEWNEVYEFKRPRIFASLCVTSKYLFVFGGFYKENPSDYLNFVRGPNKEIPEVERYDFQKNISEVLFVRDTSSPLHFRMMCIPTYSEDILIFCGKTLRTDDSNRYQDQAEKLVLHFDTETYRYKEIAKISQSDGVFDVHYRFTQSFNNIELLAAGDLEKNVMVLKYDLVLNQLSTSSGDKKVTKVC